MTGSILDIPCSRAAKRPARLKHTCSGLRHIEKVHQQIASSLLNSHLIQRSEDFLNCISHEIRFLERFPANALGAVQQERLEKLCQHAIGSLRFVENDCTSPSIHLLKDAFEKLLPLISKDFGTLSKVKTP